KIMLARLPQRRRTITSHMHLKTRKPQRRRQQLTNIRLILHNKEPGLRDTSSHKRHPLSQIWESPVNDLRAACSSQVAPFTSGGVRRGQHVVLVDDPVGVALFGQESLTVSGEVGVDGVA